jgi:hypothetical protein
MRLLDPVSSAYQHIAVRPFGIITIYRDSSPAANWVSPANLVNYANDCAKSQFVARTTAKRACYHGLPGTPWHCLLHLCLDCRGSSHCPQSDAVSPWILSTIRASYGEDFGVAEPSSSVALFARAKLPRIISTGARSNGESGASFPHRSGHYPTSSGAQRPLSGR